jgi:hypothetical protein
VETLVRDFLGDVSRQRSADEKGNHQNPAGYANGNERDG